MMLINGRSVRRGVRRILNFARAILLALLAPAAYSCDMLEDVLTDCFGIDQRLAQRTVQGIFFGAVVPYLVFVCWHVTSWADAAAPEFLRRHGSVQFDVGYGWWELLTATTTIMSAVLIIALTVLHKALSWLMALFLLWPWTAASGTILSLLWWSLDDP